MKALVSSFILSALLFFNSCSSSHRHHHVPVHSAPAYKVDYSSQAPVKKESYDLAELIDLALASNRDTKRAWASANLSYKSYQQGKSNLFPELNLSASGSRSYTSVKEGQLPNSQTTYGPSLTLSYLLFDFGERSNAHESLLHSFHSDEILKNRSIQTVIQEVITRYVDYLASKEIQENKWEDFSDAKKSLEVIQELKSAGIKTQLDVLRTKADFSSKKIQLEEARGKVAIALARLKNTVAFSEKEILNVRGSLDTYTPVDLRDDVETLVARAKKMRGDLLSAKHLLNKQHADLKQAKAASLPKLTTQAELGKNFFGSAPNENYHATGSVGFSIPLFKGFFYQRAVEKAEEALSIAEANYDNIYADVALDVLTQHANYETAVIQYQHSTEYLKFAQEAYQATMSSYQNGLTNIQGLLDAHSELVSARQQRVLNKQNWMLSLVNLVHATGELYEGTPLYKKTNS